MLSTSISMNEWKIFIVESILQIPIGVGGVLQVRVYFMRHERTHEPHRYIIKRATIL